MQRMSLRVGLGAGGRVGGKEPADPAYTNEGGTGDRSSIITVTASSYPFDAGSAQALVDGSTNSGGLSLPNNDPAAGAEIVFDFGYGAEKIITEARVYQANLRSHGTWKWQGSNDAKTWTDLGASFTLGENYGGPNPFIAGDLSGNASGYRFYRLLNISGDFGNSTFYQVEFQIGWPGSDNPSRPPFDGAYGATITQDPTAAIPTGYGFDVNYSDSNAVLVKEIDPMAVLKGRNDVWWDATDGATITKDGSDRVSLWEDKTGNGFNLRQDTAASAPTANAVINGRAAVDWRPNKTMTIDRVPFAEQIIYIWAAMWSSDESNNYFLDSDNIKILGNRVFIGDTTVTAPENETFRNIVTTMHARTSAGSGATTTTLRINGYEEETTGVTLDARGLEVFIGERKGNLAPFNGLLGELIICHRPESDPLTMAEIDAMNDRMRRRWRNVEPVSDFKVVGLMGQSNMVGVSGPADADLDMPTPRIAQLGRFDHRADKVVLAMHPLDHQPYAMSPAANEIGLALEAARDGLATLGSSEGILLVPSAHGATRITSWQKGHGSGLYDDLLTRMQTAIAKDQASLWGLWCHQGEGDALDGMTEATYAGHMDQFISDIRGDLAVADLPVVWGQIGTWVSGPGSTTADINAAIADLPNRVSHTAYASSASLTDNGDSLHFSPAGYRTLGDRFWSAFATLLP